MKKRFLSKLQLARALKLSRNTVAKYLSMPAAPRPDKKFRYEKNAVARFIADRGSANVEGSEMRDLRALKLRLETEQLQDEANRRRGETITKTEIAPAIAAFMVELTSNLRTKFELELPSKYRGKNLIECQQLNRAAIDFILGRLKAGQWALALDLPAPADEK